VENAFVAFFSYAMLDGTCDYVIAHSASMVEGL